MAKSRPLSWPSYNISELISIAVLRIIYEIAPRIKTALKVGSLPPISYPLAFRNTLSSRSGQRLKDNFFFKKFSGGEGFFFPKNIYFGWFTVAGLVNHPSPGLIFANTCVTFVRVTPISSDNSRALRKIVPGGNHHSILIQRCILQQNQLAWALINSCITRFG